MQRYFLIFLIGMVSKSMSQIADSSLRLVRLQGALNCRDIGGYKTASGRTVKWGRIYRSAEISKLTAADFDTLEKRKINFDFDFRGPAEFNAAPDKIPASIIRVSLPAGSEDAGNSLKMFDQMRKVQNGDSIMLPFYNNTAPFEKRYKPVFDALLSEKNDHAILYHCTAGKDRTGIATALILYALGVDKNTIMEDYLASNYYRQNDAANMRKMLVDKYHLSEAVVNDVMGVKASYLNATFDAITAKYGTIDKFLKKEMGLNKRKMKKLRRMYLD